MKHITTVAILLMGLYLNTGCRDNNIDYKPKNPPNKPIDEIPTTGGDQRAYQHGIDFLPLSNGNYALIWASSGDPLNTTNSNAWEHDIYYSYINPQSPFIDPIKIISNPEAQEPASSAITKDGHIMITMEDGYAAENVLAQRYGIYDENFNNIKPYPVNILDGGHSGHVTAVGNRFVAIYSEGWIDGGGVDNLGSGDNVHLAIFSSDGTVEKRKDIAVGNATRDWWAVLAGSESTALLVWQQFIDDKEYVDLKISLINPETGILIKEDVTLMSNVKYYTYSVTYLPHIDSYLVLGVYQGGGGFGILLDNTGEVITSNLDLPEIVRESQSMVKADGDKQIIVQPKSPNGLMTLAVSKTKIALLNEIEDGYNWQYAGTDGIWTDDNHVYIVSLSTIGIVEKLFKVNY